MLLCRHKGAHVLGNAGGGARYAEGSGTRYAKAKSCTANANAALAKLSAGTRCARRKKERRHNPEAELSASTAKR